MKPLIAVAVLVVTIIAVLFIVTAIINPPVSPIPPRSAEFMQINQCQIACSNACLSNPDVAGFSWDEIQALNSDTSYDCADLMEGSCVCRSP